VPRFHVPGCEPDATTVELPADEAQHLTQVLRLGIGDAAGVFDGRGREWRGVVAVADRRRATIDRLVAVPATPEPAVRVTLGVGVLKGDQMDRVVRDATALGAVAVAPVASSRVTVPRRAWSGGAADARWARVAAAAAKQCGRAVVPAIAPVAPLEARLAAASSGGARVVVAVEPAVPGAAGVEALRAGGRPHDVLALVGPEGGWAGGDLALARAAGATFVHLGPRTLRAEVVPVVLLTALWVCWGWD
jgi:16S rRNA (uracil1498-N3)-methyltransferase